MEISVIKNLKLIVLKRKLIRYRKDIFLKSQTMPSTA